VRRRRRTRPFLTVVAVLFGLLAVASVLYWKRPQPPFAVVEQANQAIRLAREKGAIEYCPDHIRAAEDTLQIAWRLIREQNRRVYFLRDFGAVARAAEKARLAAVEAETLAVAIEDSLRQESNETIRMAEVAVAEVREEMSRVAPNRTSRANLSRLEVGLAEVKHLHKQSAYRESLERARFVVDGATSLEKATYASLQRYASDRGRWRKWADETISWSRRTGGTAVVVQKIAHTVELYQGGKLVRQYRADLGSAWMGQKMHLGDNATPEGRYHITNKKGPRETKYYKALLLDYPNDEDRRRFSSAKKNGELTRRASIGGLIEIHGHGGRGEDWTQGCVALGNNDMDHLYGRVSVGTPVTIVGTIGEID